MGCLRAVLKEIYGNVAEDLLIENRDELKKTDELNTIIKTKITRQSPCLECENAQHQDFPGWIGQIQYENNRIDNKNIILFGLEVSDKKSVKGAFNKNYGYDLESIKDMPQIHIGYELGYFKIFEDLVKAHWLWRNLNYIIPLEKLIDIIYFTDIAKCFTDDKHQAQNKCAQKFLIKELNCFKDDDLVIILQGRDSMKFFNDYFEFTIDSSFQNYLHSNKEKLGEFGFNTKDPNFQIGDFHSKQKEIDKIGRFLFIPHSSSHNNTLWSKFRKFNELDQELFSQFQNLILNFLNF